MHIALLLAQIVLSSPKTPEVRYVFLFIGDGMGLNQVALTEAYQASMAGDSIGFVPVSFTRFPVFGTTTTHCATKRTTESAAAATAIASGHKAGEGALGMGVGDHAVLRTIAEEARDVGRKVGILTTVSIDHATPAGFYAHVANRNSYNDIGMALARSRFDVFAGGGFLAPTAPHDVWNELRSNRYTITRGVAALRSHKKGPVLALTPDSPATTALPWTIDRTANDSDQPTLAEYVRQTIRLLESNPAGFFVMAEAGRIDWAGHSNDPGATIGEVQSLDSAVQVALDFARSHPGEVLIVVTADHETGGLALGNDKLGYNSSLGLLRHQIASQDVLAATLRALLALPDSSHSLDSCLATIGRLTGLGREPALALTSEERAELGKAWAGERTLPSEKRGSEMARSAIALLSTKAGIGWTTHAHTFVPVPVYAWGAGAEVFAGRLDNTHIAWKLRKAMGLRPKPVIPPAVK